MKNELTKVLIYGKQGCKYCVEAKKLAMEAGYKVDYKDLTNDLPFLNSLKASFATQTVPIILINDKFIGGCSDLFQYISARI